VLPHPSGTPHVSAAPPVIDPIYPKMSSSTPLFLPPPFTPADPIFAYLSSFAQSLSDSARRQAQAELDTFMGRKIEGSLELDRRLRHEVDLLWANWRNAWQDMMASPEQRSSNLYGPLLSGISSNGTPGLLQAAGPSTSQTGSESRSFRPVVPIRDDFESITQLTVAPDASLSTPHTPVGSPPAQHTSLLSQARTTSSPLSKPHNLPDEPSSRSRSPRMLLRRLSSDAKDVAVGSLSTSPYDRPHSRSRSRCRSPSGSGGRLLVDAAADESRVIAASFQIMMSDTMAPARAAYLARRGLPTTYDEEEEQAQEDMSHLTPASGSGSKANSTPQSPRTPKSPGQKKTVSFQATDDLPKRNSKRSSLPPPQRSNESGPILLLRT